MVCTRGPGEGNGNGFTLAGRERVTGGDGSNSAGRGMTRDIKDTIFGAVGEGVGRLRDGRITGRVGDGHWGSGLGGFGIDTVKEGKVMVIIGTCGVDRVGFMVARS